MARAVWNGQVIAETAGGMLVETNVYFPPEAVRAEFLRPAEGGSICQWKGGTARYFDVAVAGKVAPGAAWTYPEVGEIAQSFRGWFAFWRGVVVEDAGTATPFAAPLPNVARALRAGRVEWRPDLAALGVVTTGAFAGYLIPELRVLVDVAAATDAGRAAEVARARALAAAVANKAGEPLGHVAVWGSAIPAPEVLAQVAAGRVVLALDAVPEIVTPGPGRT